MVPGIFPSQLEILSTGQTYFETDIRVEKQVSTRPQTEAANDPRLS